MSEPIPTPNPNFVEALNKNQKAAQELPPMTLWRYTNGKLPKALRWLLSHPDLLQALYTDASTKLIQSDKNV